MKTPLPHPPWSLALCTLSTVLLAACADEDHALPPPLCVPAATCTDTASLQVMLAPDAGTSLTLGTYTVRWDNEHFDRTITCRLFQGEADGGSACGDISAAGYGPLDLAVVDENRIINILVDGTAPAQSRVTVTLDGTLLGEGDAEVFPQRKTPNGRFCDPKCWNRASVLHVPRR